MFSNAKVEAGTEARLLWGVCRAARESSEGADDIAARLDVEELEALALHTDREAIRECALDTLCGLAIRAANLAARAAARRALGDLAHLI